MKIRKLAQVGAIVAKVIDSFLSTSSTDALSAGKGKELKDLIDGKKFVRLYHGTSGGGVINTNVDVTLSETMQHFDLIMVVIGYGGADVITVLLTVDYFAGAFSFRALNAYYVNGTITSSDGQTNVRFNVREVGGWSASNIHIYEVYGLSL